MRRFQPVYETHKGWYVQDMQTLERCVTFGGPLNDNASRVMAEESATRLNLYQQELAEAIKKIIAKHEQNLTQLTKVYQQ